MHLIFRSLVIVVKPSSTGGVKTCRVHDLLPEFCVEKAKEVGFFQLLKGYDELSGFNEPQNLSRLCIYSKPEHFMESRLFCPRLRSLFFNHGEMDERVWFNLSFGIRILKLVRVLDLSQIHVGSIFPSEIDLLVQLRYLGIQGNMLSIPSSIANLSNLETFIVDSLGAVVFLGDSIWNLKKLRHLRIKDNYGGGFSFSSSNSAELCALDTISTAILFWDNLEMILRKFPNIHNLKGKLLGYVPYGASAEKIHKAVILDYLSQLESLELCPFDHVKLHHMEIELCFPLNLRKLTLSKFVWPWCKISAIGNLPNLEVLKLLEGAFEGDIWNMEEAGQFRKVRFLKLTSFSLVRWTASESEDHFPCLVKLVLYNCCSLKEVPSFLGDISNLQMIKVCDCSDSAASSIKQIQEEQPSMGNEDLKVIISSKI